MSKERTLNASDVASLQPRDLPLDWGIGSQGCGGGRSGQLSKWCDGGHDGERRRVMGGWLDGGKCLVSEWESFSVKGNVRVGER